jgi:MEMO1 family protein
MNPLVQLARWTIAQTVRSGSPPRQVPEGLSARIGGEPAGVFVSLHRRGELRGCIGTFLPLRASLAEEILHNAVAAATRDRRFPPLGPEELGDLDIRVDVLSPPEAVEGEADLDPRRYGVIVGTPDGRRGLLLPDLEGVDTVGQQVSICRRKGGIRDDEPVTLQRFTVERHSE